MITYKHTQVGYLMIVVVLLVLILFSYIQIISRLEPVSTDSGANLLVTVIMALILFIITSFSTLTIWIDDKFLKLKFCCGIFHKKFLLTDIVAVARVKNRWYYGWGIKVWLWPYMWIYNVSGFDAIQIKMKNGKIYRLGTDAPDKLLQAINKQKSILS